MLPVSGAAVVPIRSLVPLLGVPPESTTDSLPTSSPPTPLSDVDIDAAIEFEVHLTLLLSFGDGVAVPLLGVPPASTTISLLTSAPTPLSDADMDSDMEFAVHLTLPPSFGDGAEWPALKLKSSDASKNRRTLFAIVRNGDRGVADVAS